MRAVWIIGTLGGMVALGVLFSPWATWVGLVVAACAYGLGIVDEASR